MSLRGECSKELMETPLIEISRGTYGNDSRAINLHEERRYRTADGKLYTGDEE